MDPRVANLPANRCKPKEKPVLCPFGCVTRHVDPHGYCKHLVGFTIDGKTVEMREKVADKERTGSLTDTVKPTDVLVEMATVTKRVYRKDGNAPLNLALDQDTDDKAA